MSPLTRLLYERFFTYMPYRIRCRMSPLQGYLFPTNIQQRCKREIIKHIREGYGYCTKVIERLRCGIFIA